MLLNRRHALWLGLATTACSIIDPKSKFSKQSIQTQALEDLPRDFIVVGESSLKELAAAKGLIYGALPDGEYEEFSQDTEYQSRFIQECGLLVKVILGIERSQNNFDFTASDYYAKFAAENGILFRGHPLVWYLFNPQWLNDKFKNPNTSSREIESILVNYISTVVKRYAGQVHSWDVVNEAINVNDGRADGLRDTKVSGVAGEKYPTWLNFLGPDYIDLAFRVAAEADPQAMLVYNETAVEYDIPEEQSRRNAVLNLLDRLKSQGTPIHALGIQAHLHASRNKYFNPTKFRKFLRDVASLGLKILITELDVSEEKLPQNMDIKTRDLLIAESYRDFLSAALDESAVIAVVTWGLSDRGSWLSFHAPRKDGLPVRPLPLDAQLNRKLAWNAIANAFDNAPQR